MFLTQLELTYLHEIGRLKVSGAEIVGDLRERIGFTSSDVTTIASVEAAAPLSWTRDPFDRMSAADALASNCALITKDELIRSNLASAVW